MDWTAAASLATAGGTLVLAVATFASVRSSNRSARLAEYSMQLGIRPLLMPSRLGNAPPKNRWGGGHPPAPPRPGAPAGSLGRHPHFPTSGAEAGSRIP